MNTAVWLSFLGVSILLTLAPGPDIMYLLTKSISSGGRVGVSLAMGLASGPIFHTCLVMFGVSAFFQSNPVAMKGFAFFGAAYLLYLAFSALRARPEVMTMEEEGGGAGFFSLYRQGLLMNVLNPKVLLFFLALFPQFIDENGLLPPAIQIGVLGLTFSAQACLVFSAVALCASRVRALLVTYRSFPLIMHRIEGAILALLAGGLLFL